ncbi:glycoside hydrolase family 25 protein [Mycobacterium marinum]|uniref:glycoside hydrolase family 25 protein n=1 Tax=Mycobacterium marinum TaxID=1781 RepID=UPI00356ACDE4
MTYGLPAGANITYGAPGFPDWVYQLGQAFGLKASTYPGHQESDRAEAGYAPNPQHLNRGIDWSGPVDNMQRFAEYLLSIRGQLEQVIWQNPNTGQRIGVAGGQDVSQTGYYAGDYAGHRDHVHTRQDNPIPLPGGSQPVTIYGVDISNNNGQVDIAAIKREGFDFLWCKVSEGAAFKDSFWPSNRDQAREQGLILAGYHYAREGDPAAQADNFVSHLGDKSIPAMLDFEDGSGGIDNYWAVKREVEARGVRVALSYIPDWYWERIGKPDLSGVPGLIASEYVNGSDYAIRLYPGDNWRGWNPYGGRQPDILQFTSSAVIAGKRLDANAFRGTPNQLRKLLLSLSPEGDDELSDTVLYASQSIYATPGEGAIWSIPQLVRNIDGMVHFLYTNAAARLGDFAEIARVARTANGQGVNTDPNVVARARNLIAELSESHPDMMRAFLAQNGAGQ